jgi:DNA-binding protein YbaB
MTETTGQAGSADSPFQKAIDELQEAVSALEEADKRLSAASYTGRSKDRTVEVTVGAQGEMTRVKFVGEKHRSLSGAELGAAVLEAAQRARAHMAEAMLSTFRPLTEQTEAIRRGRSSTMGVNWDRIFGQFEEAVATGGLTRTAKKKSTLRDEIVEDPENRVTRQDQNKSKGGQEK